jgi:transcriptional regulator with XRE-family HTH domain
MVVKRYVMDSDGGDKDSPVTSDQSPPGVSHIQSPALALLAEKMKAARIARSVSMRAMGRSLGLKDHTFLSRIESEGAWPSRAVVEGYERVLRLPVGELTNLWTAERKPVSREPKVAYVRPTSQPDMRMDHITIDVMLSGRFCKWYRAEYEVTALADDVGLIMIKAGSYGYPAEYEFVTGGTVASHRTLVPDHFAEVFTLVHPLSKGDKHKFGYTSVQNPESDLQLPGIMSQAAPQQRLLTIRVWLESPEPGTVVEVLTDMPPWAQLPQSSGFPLLDISKNGFGEVSWKRLVVGNGYGVKWNMSNDDI